MRACCWCVHYNPVSYLYSTIQRDVSGGKCWYRRWNDHRCLLKQEDKYPKNCDFKEDTEKVRIAKENFEEWMRDRSFMSSML